MRTWYKSARRKSRLIKCSLILNACSFRKLIQFINALHDGKFWIFITITFILLHEFSQNTEHLHESAKLHLCPRSCTQRLYHPLVYSSVSSARRLPGTSDGLQTCVSAGPCTEKLCEHAKRCFHYNWNSNEVLLYRMPRCAKFIRSVFNTIKYMEMPWAFLCQPWMCCGVEVCEQNIYDKKWHIQNQRNWYTCTSTLNKTL